MIGGRFLSEVDLYRYAGGRAAIESIVGPIEGEAEQAVNTALVSAEEEAVSYLSGVYSLPLTPETTPQGLKVRIGISFSYYLSLAVNRVTGEDLENRYKTNINFYLRVYDGKAQIEGLDLLETTSAATVRGTSEKPAPHRRPHDTGRFRDMYPDRAPCYSWPFDEPRPRRF